MKNTKILAEGREKRVGLDFASLHHETYISLISSRNLTNTIFLAEVVIEWCDFRVHSKMQLPDQAELTFNVAKLTNNSIVLVG